MTAHVYEILWEHGEKIIITLKESFALLNALMHSEILCIIIKTALHGTIVYIPYHIARTTTKID